MVTILFPGLRDIQNDGAGARHFECREDPEADSRTPLYGHPLNTDTHLLRTKRKTRIFSLTLARFLRTSVNTDNGHFSVASQSYKVNFTLRTLVICAL